MSLDLVREAIKVNQAINRETAQTVIDNDIIVPDSKPDIAQILLLDGDIAVSNSEAVENRVLVSGMIQYKILYLSDDPEHNINSINTASNFIYSLDVPNTERGMKSSIKCDVEHIDYDILNGRKINVKTIVDIRGKVTNELEHYLVNDIKGVEEVQILRDGFSINQYIGNNSDNHLIKESLEIPAGKPAIREILRNDVKVNNKDYKITEGKVAVKGELNIITLFIGDNEERSIQYMEHEIPFTRFIDLPEINEESGCEVSCRIVDSKFDAGEDSDGELRILNAEIGMNIYVEGYVQRNIQVISDAYSPRSSLSLERTPAKMEEMVAENKSQVLIRDTVNIGEENPEMIEIFNVISKPGISEARVSDDKVIIEGVVDNNILYLTNSLEQPVLCHKQELPLKHGIDVKGVKPDMNCEVEFNVEHCNYSMISTREAEIRLTIGVTARIMKQVIVPLIERVNENPYDEKRSEPQPSITIYFSQPGDTLWSIAKRYRTTIDDIRRVNNLDSIENTLSGKQILIPRKIV